MNFATRINRKEVKGKDGNFYVFYSLSVIDLETNSVLATYNIETNNARLLDYTFTKKDNK